MRLIPKTITSAIIVSIAVLALASCKSSNRGPKYKAAGRSKPYRGGALRFTIVQGIRSLDQVIAYDEYSLNSLHYLHDTLLGYEGATEGTGTKLVPQLAQSWSVSGDGLTYKFVLRPGIKFSNGTPVVAADFKYAIERVLTTAASPFIQFLLGIDGAKELVAKKSSSLSGLVVTDSRHLEFRLKRPDASFPMILAMKMAAPQKRAHVQAAGKNIRREVLGTGPFVLESWTEGIKLVFARNKHYWDARLPYLDKMVIYTNIPRDTAFLKFEAGEVDTIDRLSSADYIWIAQRKDWQPFIFNQPSMNSYGERMNTQVKPFNDKRVRQAMNYAVNKKHYIKLYNGRGVIAHGILPPLMPGFNSKLKPYPYDPAKARKLLAEAGYPNGFSVKYACLKDDQAEKLAQSLQADLKHVGIDMTIELMSFSTYLTATGKPDGVAFSYGAWLMDYPDPSNFTDVKFHSRMIAKKNSNNDTFFSHPRLDRILDAAKAETDQTKRWKLYHEIEEILYDEAPWIWAYHQTYVEVRQPYVQNYRPHPVWGRDYRSTWIDVGKDGKRVAR